MKSPGKIKKPPKAGQIPAPPQGLRTPSSQLFAPQPEGERAFSEQPLPSRGAARGHHFGEVALTPPQSEVSSAFYRLHAGNCPLATPRTCPFGGACHTCPVAVQPKLAISQPGDIYEQEADRVADEVMGMSDKRLMPRTCSACDTDEDELVRPKELPGHLSVSPLPAGVPPIVQEVLRSPGQPLDPATRAFMEPRFGYDFDKIRIYSNGLAAESAKLMNARAYTLGPNVVFGAGEYTPMGDSGRRLLAHELTHVLQQQKREPHNYAIISGVIQRQEIEDCSEGHANEVRQAAAASLPAIRTTISAILRPSSPAVTQTFKRFFGESAPEYAAAIGLRLAIIASKIPRATIQCENPDSWFYNHFCGGTLGYVRSVPAFFGLGSIHLCQPNFHNLSRTHQMATLIHEAAHRYIDAADHDAYYTMDCQETAETRALSDFERRYHADSYCCLVQTLGTP